jgi:hypothetical protein
MGAAGWAALSSGEIALGAQVEPAKPAPSIAAKPADVSSMDALIASIYASISGPAGTRDWDRLRSLFHPAARLMSCSRPRDVPPGEVNSMRVFSVEEFIKAIEPRVKAEGFFEREIARRVDRFGAVAHVFSTYESRHSENEEEPFTRGINSIQLFFDGNRWWTVTIFWDSERPSQPIPADYLPKR